MRCPKCGTDNPEGKIICRTCGARLRSSPVQAAAVRESDEELRSRVTYDLTRILWVIAVVIAVGAALGLLTR